MHFIDESHQTAFNSESVRLGFFVGDRDPQTLISAYFRSIPWVNRHIIPRHEDDPFQWAGNITQLDDDEIVFYANEVYDRLDSQQQQLTLLAINLYCGADVFNVLDGLSTFDGEHRDIMNEMIHLRLFGTTE